MQPGPRRSVAAVVAVAALTVVLAVVVGLPIAFSAAAVVAGVLVCLRVIRRSPAAERRLPRSLAITGMCYLVPIGIALLVQILLAAYVDRNRDTWTVGSLIALEQRFAQISRFFSEEVKLTETGVLVLLVVTYAVTSVLLARGVARSARSDDVPAGRRRVASALDRTVGGYLRYSGPVAAGLATLAAFTLFGLRLGPPAEDLQLRIKIAQEGYADVVRRGEAVVSQSVANEIYHRSMDSLPSGYRDALQLPGDVDTLSEDVRTHADRARTDHGVGDPEVDRRVREARAATAKLATLPTDHPVGRPTDPGPRVAPPEVTPRQIAAAREALATPRLRPPGTQLLPDGQKKIVLQIEKLVTERIAAAAKPITEAVPALDPVLQTFLDAVDQIVQNRIDQVYDRVVAASVTDPASVGRVLEQEVRQVADRAGVEAAAERATPEAREQAEQLRRVVEGLAASKPVIDRKVAEQLARRAVPNPRPRLLVRPLPRIVPPYLPPYAYRPPPSLYRPSPFDARIPSPGARVPRPVTPPPARATPRFFW